jgi:hypothetical protein
MVAAFVDPTDFRLNGAARRADIPAMAGNAGEGAAAGWKERLAGLRDGLILRRGRRPAPPSDADQELQALRTRVALLAMHVDYWRYRSGEHAAARRVAEAEVARLTEALASTDPALVNH